MVGNRQDREGRVFLEDSEKVTGAFNHNIVATEVKTNERVTANDTFQEVCETCVTQIVLPEVDVGERVSEFVSICVHDRYVFGSNDLTENSCTLGPKPSFIHLNGTILDTLLTVLEEAKLLLPVTERQL